MEHKCSKCDRVTEGLKMTINGEHIFRCRECKTEQSYVPKRTPVSPAIVVNCSGFVGRNTGC